MTSCEEFALGTFPPRTEVSISTAEDDVTRASEDLRKEAVIM